MDNQNMNDIKDLDPLNPKPLIIPSNVYGVGRNVLYFSPHNRAIAINQLRHGILQIDILKSILHTPSIKAKFWRYDYLGTMFVSKHLDYRVIKSAHINFNHLVGIKAETLPHPPDIVFHTRFKALNTSSSVIHIINSFKNEHRMWQNL